MHIMNSLVALFCLYALVSFTSCFLLKASDQNHPLSFLADVYSTRFQSVDIYGKYPKPVICVRQRGRFQMVAVFVSVSKSRAVCCCSFHLSMATLGSA